MNKLIRLELKRNKLTSYYIALAVICIAIWNKCPLFQLCSNSIVSATPKFIDIYM